MRRRIIICLGVLLALCLTASVTAMVCLYQSIDQLTRVADSHMIQSLRADLASNAVRIESNIIAYVDGHRTGTEVIAAGRGFRQSLHRCAGCHHDPSIQAELDALVTTYGTYNIAAAEVLATDGDSANRLRLRPPHTPAEQNIEKIATALVGQADRLSERASSHMSFRSASDMPGIRSVWILLLATLAATLVVGGFVAFHLERRLTRPVASLLEGIELAGRGKLPEKFTVKADKEFRTLAHAFENAYRNLDAAHAGIAQAEKLAAVGRLASGVAHEVGNPLASISAVMQVMRRQAGSEAQSGQIDVAMAEIARISRIIRELLLFARPNQKSKSECVDMAALLHRVTTLLSYDRRAAQIHLDLPGDGLPPVPGDADDLLTVFANIVLNAFDAMRHRKDENGSVKITGRCEGDYVVVRFEDNGIGMTEAHVARAFEPFFTTKNAGDGTGLGLWVSYRVVQQHHGSIDLQSRHEVGTTVSVKLPLRRPDGPPVIGAGNEI